MPNETYPYTLPSGATIELETLPSNQYGARDVARDDKKPLPVENLLAPLGELVEVVFEKLKSSAKTPSKVTLELGASLKGKSTLVIVSGESEASFKVTLSWENKG